MAKFTGASDIEDVHMICTDGSTDDIYNIVLVQSDG